MSKYSRKDVVAQILNLIEERSGIKQEASETIGEYVDRVSQQAGVDLTELGRVLSRLMYAPPEQALMSSEEQQIFEEALSKLAAYRPTPKPVEKPKPKEAPPSIPSEGYPTLDLGVKRKTPGPLIKVKRVALNNREKLLLAGLTIFAVISRFYLIDDESLWLDEFDAAYAIAPGLTWEKVSSYLFSNKWTDHHPPLYHIIMHHWIQVFGNSELSVRGFSASMGIATIICIYYIATDMFNWKVGLVSALSLLLNYVHVYYCQEARPYAFSMLLVILSTYLFYRMLNNSRKYRTMYILSSMMLIYTDYMSFFLLGIHFTYYLSSILRNKDFAETKYMFLTFLLISLVYIPWISEFMNGYSTYQPWRGYLQKPGADELLAVLATVSGGPSYWGGLQFVLPRVFGGTFLFGMYLPGTLLSQRFWFIFVSSVVLIALYRVLKMKVDKKAEALIFLVSTIPLIMFVLSITVKAIFDIRQVSIFLPVISILTSLGIYYSAECLSKKRFLGEKKMFAVILLVFVIMWSLDFAAYYKGKERKVKEDWRGAVRYVEELGIKNVAIYPDYNDKCFKYYQNRGDTQIMRIYDLDDLNRVDKEFGQYVLIISQWAEEDILSELREHSHRIENVTKEYRSLIVYVVSNPNKIT